MSAETLIKSLPVRQLTAREAADFLDSIRGGFRIHAIDILMDGHSVPSPLVFAATGTDYDSFPLDVPPDDLPRLLDEVQRLNPFLVEAAKKQIERQVAALDKMAAELDKLIKTPGTASVGFASNWHSSESTTP